MQLLFFCYPYVAFCGVPLQSYFQFFSLDVVGVCLSIKQFACWLCIYLLTYSMNSDPIHSMKKNSTLWVCIYIYIYVRVWDEKYGQAMMSLLFSFLQINQKNNFYFVLWWFSCYLSSGHRDREPFHFSFMETKTISLGTHSKLLRRLAQ